MKPSQVLDRLFDSGAPPALEYFLGEDDRVTEWNVIMLTGSLPNLNFHPVNHRKRFFIKRNQIMGVNMILKGTRFGWFEPRRTSWLPDATGKAMIFDYEVPQNGRIMSKVRDYIRLTTEPGLLLGRFYYGKRFVSYFAMSKIPSIGQDP